MTPTRLHCTVVTSAILLLLFPVLLTCLVLALVAGGFALAAGSSGLTTLLGAKIMLLAIPLVGAVIAAVRQAFSAQVWAGTPGPRLTAADEPRLWAELTVVGQWMGQPLPDRLVIAPEANACVREHHGQRELVIGLPLLAALTRSQLRAVLAHEFGHLAAGHTRGSRTLLRAEQFLQRTVHGMRPGLVRQLLTGYLITYLAVSRPVLRAHELDCDQQAARLTGSRVTARALWQVHSIGMAWHAVLHEYAPLFASAGRRASLTTALSEVLRARGPQLSQAISAAAQAGSAFDTHPPLAQRLAALNRLALPAPGPGAAGDEPAWSLLQDPPGRLDQLEAVLWPRPDHQAPLTWPELTHQAAAHAMAGRSRLIMGRLVAERPGVLPTATNLLRALAAGQGPELARPLVRADMPAGDVSGWLPFVLQDTVTAVLVCLLNAAGALRVEPSWGSGEPYRLMLAGAGQPVPWPLAEAIGAAARDPRRVPDLATLATSLGAGLDLELEAVHEQPASSLRGALCLVTATPPLSPGRMDRHDVLVYDDGMLVVRTPREALTGFRQSIGVLLRPLQVQLDQADARMAALSQAVGPLPHTAPTGPARTATWIDYSAVRSLRWTSGLAQEHLVLTMHDNTERRFSLHPSQQSQVLGHARAALAQGIG